MPSALRLALLGIWIATCLALPSPANDQPLQVGPPTEKRFPPLQVPAGFKATLFACDPLIEYPSVISAGPRPGALFVAIDYMTGLGVEIVRRDEIRLVEDTDGDGYADRATVFAGGFNSIQGLAYHDGTLYVMHAPFLTALRDSKGMGVADERRDLLTGLGLAPEKNPTRLHCSNGVVVGHDGWLYLALGDNGVDVMRPEGDRLVLHGGGILRCRPDGRDLHVFATGLRNIYDVALDAELNVFVRDNENDGGTYMVRVCHSFHGADHGYPYLYEERPDEALPPLADLGRGSSAGGICYRETHFPPEYRGNLFFCEWGQAVVRYQPRLSGSGFAPVQELLFVAGDPRDPYGFKPTDLVVQRDGTLMVSDWADGQRPKRGRGRIYHIAHTGGGNARADRPSDHLTRLGSASYSERWDAQLALERQGLAGRKVLTEALEKGRPGVLGRLHVVWALAHLDRTKAITVLMRLARTDPELAVRVQAVRAVADLADPVLVHHRLDAGPGDAGLAEQLADLGKGQDPRVMREVIIALGRLRWPGLADWLRQEVGRIANPSHQPDAALAHAAMQALRRSANWPAILKLLDEPVDMPLRAIALRAVAERFEPPVVDGLIERLGKATKAARRREYADALARVCKKPGPWVYWGYRPAPRPASSAAWERTEAIAQALDRVLADLDRELRLFVLRRSQREKVPLCLATLTRWLEDEHQPERVAALLTSLGEFPAAQTRPYLEAVVRDRKHISANRLTALTSLVGGLDEAGPSLLLVLARALEDGPVLADVLRRMARYPRLPAAAVLGDRLKSPDAEVRAAAIETLGTLRAREGGELVVSLLQDKDPRVRCAAAGAVGKLGERQAIESLLKLASDPDALVRRASLDSLRLLREPRAVPLAIAALADRELELKALECLRELGGPGQAGAMVELTKRNPSAEILNTAVRVLTAWRDREGLDPRQWEPLESAVAQVHGASGSLVRWQAENRRLKILVPEIVRHFSFVGATPFPEEQTFFATGPEGRILLAPKSDPETAWLAYTEMSVAEATPVEFLASSSGSLKVFLNGKVIYQRDQTREFRLDSDRFASTLVQGQNRVLVQVGPGGTAAQFQLRFRRKSSTAAHEQLTQAVLSRTGNPERGRQLFFNTEKSLCLKCHRLGSQGERIGPELTGVGSRFSRIYLVESILEPSRTIAPSFGTLVITLKNGKTLTGLKIAETDKTLTLADNQGQKHTLIKEEIEEQQASPRSTMPEGLEKRFTETELIDLIAFLVSQKKG